eukprot:TRINITY_DN4146_c0_g2_i1.p1 TRINITY_DN4146_c0_g2~~TRINITY_DN4146_c0_g2_i1.p1  ORF type:complete len:378 (+),score=70.49 TRINITY_DN4146_c0_g2_i1:69-1202(+)
MAKLFAEWQVLTPWGKRMLYIAIVQTLLLILYSIAVMVLNKYIDGEDSRLFNKDIAYGVLLIVSSLFFVYFAFDGVINENKFEMSAFALVSVLLTIRVIFMYTTAKTTYNTIISNSSSTAEMMQLAPVSLYLTIAIMIVICVFQVLLGLLFVKAWRGFGWKLYRTVGANKSLKSYFQDYQVFLSLLKIDMQFGVSLVLLGGFFLFDATSSVALWINVGVIVLTIFWAIFGWQLVIREVKIGMIFWFLFVVATPAYIIYKVVGFYKPSPEIDCVYAPCILFTLSGAATILFRAALVLYAIKCYRNFDKGMKRVFGTDGAQPKSPSTTLAPPTTLTSKPSTLPRALTSGRLSSPPLAPVSPTSGSPASRGSAVHLHNQV